MSDTEMGMEPTITNSYSMDIIIKICITMTTFLIFLFLSAWYMTKKNYKLPKEVVPETSIITVRDLVSKRFLNQCYQAGCITKNSTRMRPVSARIMDNKIAIIVNDLDWLMQNKSNFIFTVPFSLVPKPLRKFWKGILFNKDSREKDVLLCLLIKGFESLDWCVILKSLVFGARPSLPAHSIPLLVAFEAIFGYATAVDDPDKENQKMIFVQSLSNLVNEFSFLFYEGRRPPDDEAEPEEELIDRVDQLLGPVVESALFHCDSQYHESVPASAAPNLLAQIAVLRHHLSEEAVTGAHGDGGPISIDDVCHCLFEHLFVLSELLRDCFEAVARLPSPIIDAVAREVRTELCTGNRRQVTERQLEASHGLVLTKAVAQELMRVACPGAQFDLLLAERDCHLVTAVGDWDVPEASVLLFNQVAFCRSRCFSVVDRADAATFRAGRFVRWDSTANRYQFVNSGVLVAFQDQYNFVGLPRNFVCRVLLLLLVKGAVPGFDLALIEGGQGEEQGPQYELLADLETKFLWDDH